MPYFAAPASRPIEERIRPLAGSAVTKRSTPARSVTCLRAVALRSPMIVPAARFRRERAETTFVGPPDDTFPPLRPKNIALACADRQLARTMAKRDGLTNRFIEVSRIHSAPQIASCIGNSAVTGVMPTGLLLPDGIDTSAISPVNAYPPAGSSPTPKA